MVSLKPSEFSKERYLDEGASGKVFEGTFRKQQVAIKKIRAKVNNEDDWKREAKILQ